MRVDLAPSASRRREVRRPSQCFMNFLPEPAAASGADEPDMRRSISFNRGGARRTSRWGPRDPPVQDVAAFCSARPRDLLPQVVTRKQEKMKLITQGRARRAKATSSCTASSSPRRRKRQRLRRRAVVMIALIVILLAAMLLWWYRPIFYSALLKSAGHLFWDAKSAVVELVLTLLAVLVQRRK